MPRIDPVAAPYPPRVEEDLGKLMPPGVPPIGLFRTLAHNPRVLRRFRRGGLLDPGSVSVRERELVILRATARCGSEYEWGVHVAFFGGAAGFTEEQIRSTVRGGPDDACWSPEEALLLRLVDALHESAEVPAAIFAQLRERYDEAQLLELVVLAGQYRMISYVTELTRLELEPEAPRFPSG